MLTKIRIVLVETSHPGNIGSVARAMKTMGLRDLCLVKPHFFPHPDATALAAGADDLLMQAGVVSSLDEAIAPCQLVLGLTARPRSIEWPSLVPREAADMVAREAEIDRIAFVFGREQSGLSNDELARCHHAVTIPADPQYSSLNLAAAVQIICYELFQHAPLAAPRVESAPGTRYVTADDMEGFFDHCAEAMQHVGFFDAGNPQIVMRRLRRLFSRTRLDENEHNIWRGFFRAVVAQTARKTV